MHARRLIPLLAACSAIGPIGNFIMLPALPQIAATFNVTVPAAQLTITVYLLAFALGVLLSGPLADRFGRRPLLIGGLLVAAAGALLGYLADSLFWVVVARAIQGAGSSAGVTVSRAAVGDLFAGRELARMIAVLTMAMVFGTALSPYAGGLIVTYLGWQNSFALLCSASLLIAAAIWRWLPEIRPASSLGSSFAVLWRESLLVVRQPVFVGYILQAGLIYAVFVVFISLAPHVMSHMQAATPEQFGLYYLFLSGGYFIGNLVVSRNTVRFSDEQLTFWGLAMQFAGTVLPMFLIVFGAIELLYIFVPMFFVAIGQGLSLPNITARGVSLAPGYTGVASSMMGFSQIAIAALGVQLMGFAPSDRWLPVLGFCAIASAIAFACIVVLQRRDRLALVGSERQPPASTQL